jgi:hypothetical protein
VVVLKVRVFMVCVAVLLDWGHARKRLTKESGHALPRARSEFRI